MDMKIHNKQYVIPADKFTWSKFERTECGPQGERQDACNNRVSSKSLIRMPWPLDSRFRALLSGIKFSQGNKSVAEVGQHKAVPLLAVASGCGPSACNASLMQAYVCQLRPSMPSFSRQRAAVHKKFVLPAKTCRNDDV